MRLIRNPLLWLTAAVLLAGCNSGQPGGAAAAATAAKKAGRPADALMHTMVSAVPANKPPAVPVQVRFDLKGHPDVGQPLEVDLAIVPQSATVDRISGTVAGDEGLELIEGEQIPPAEHLADGVPITHALKLRPLKDGIFTFTATLTVDSAGKTATETFRMPVIAGAGLTSAPAKSATPAPAAQ